MARASSVGVPELSVAALAGTVPGGQPTAVVAGGAAVVVVVGGGVAFALAFDFTSMQLTPPMIAFGQLPPSSTATPGHDRAQERKPLLPATRHCSTHGEASLGTKTAKWCWGSAAAHATSIAI